MSERLKGKNIAFLATDGVEQVELTHPWNFIREAGGRTSLLSPNEDRIQGFNHLDRADSFPVDTPVAEADPSDYDAVVLPGGVANPDSLRTDSDAVRFVREFSSLGRPIAAICHGPWLLVEADIVAGRKLTSWPSLKTDIRNAGGEWVNREVCVYNGLITSRKPDDLGAFCDALMGALTVERS